MNFRVKALCITAIIFQIIYYTCPISACTVVRLGYNKDHYLVGQNFDWGNKFAYLSVNPSGVQHVALKFNNSEKPIKWKAKYGSVTFNVSDNSKKIDKNAVAGGMNEFGLCANILWLEDSKYPKPSKKAELDSLQWAQYFLDNARSVKEAILLSKKIDVRPALSLGKVIKVHLFLTDSNGNSSVMEYIKGKLKIYFNSSLPIAILTNTEYQKAAQTVKRYNGFGGDLPLPGGYQSQSRFVLAASYVQTLPKIKSNADAIAYLFGCLGYVIEPPASTTPTAWSVVYDLPNKIVYYRDINNQSIRYIRMRDLNFSKDSAEKSLLINNLLQGNIANFLKDRKTSS